MPPNASALAGPLEVIAVVVGFASFFAGVAGAAELARGGSGAEISDAAAYGAAAGFIIGVVAGLAAALYLVISG